jgi:XTP/dITP diphosphohydrolase
VLFDTLVLGTQNAGKIQELETLLAPLGITLRSLTGSAIADPLEDQDTFQGNALLKARYYAQTFNAPALADDSGLVIPALDGKPGIHTKRFVAEMGGETHTFKLLEALLTGRDPTAEMHCVLALAWPDGRTHTFQGICRGRLIFPPRGTGFGVDPIFQPEGSTKTFGEDQALKNKLSHRVRALSTLKDFITA